MVNSIIDAISTNVYSAFGDGYPIYSDERVQQGIDPPCFFILCISSSQKQMIGTRYYRENSVDVHYFPKVEGNYNEMLDMAEKLYSVLEYLTCSDGAIMRGSGLRHEIIEDVLHFFVDYNSYTYKVSTVESSMEDVKTNIDTKG